MPARSGGDPLQFSTRRTWRCHLGFSFGWLGVSLCPSSSSDFSLPACGGPSHFPALQPALVHLPAPQPEAKTRGHTDTEQPNMLCGTSCCLGVVCLSAGTVEQPVLVRSGVRPGPRAPNEGSAWEATCGAGQVTTSTVTTSTGVLSGSNLPLL